MSNHTAQNTLLAALHAGHTVITPNNRASHQLLSAFYMRYGHHTAIEKPSCMPYQAFVSHLFQQIRHAHPDAHHPVLLNEQQERFLWRQIILNTATYPYSTGLLHEVQTAWKRCIHWQLDLHHITFEETPQTQHFQHWALTFQETLKQHHWITADQLTDYIVSIQEHARPLTVKHPIHWACFDDFTPAQHALQKALGQCKPFDCLEPTLNATHYAASDQDDEYEQLALWLKERLASHDQHIAVVVPNLQETGIALQRYIRRQLPEVDFNLSLGQPLIDVPIIAHAMTWLTLDTNWFSQPSLRLLLFSPYLSGSRSELAARAELMQYDGLMQDAYLPSDIVYSILSKKTPILAECLQQLNPYPEHAVPSVFVRVFKTRLSQLGFPGEDALQSNDYQALQRFLNCLDTFEQLTLFNTTLSCHDALSLLNDIVQQTVFQVKQAETRLHILGLLEASGGFFDSLWLLGVTDQCLPQALRFSAFIPRSLQREHQLPHASLPRELMLAEKMLHRFQAMTQRSVYSFSSLQQDIPQLPSPLISTLPAYPRLIPENTMHLNTHAIMYQENYQVPLQQNESIRGGTALLGRQASCPFQAFAAHRLQATWAPTPSTGPNALERGHVIHRVMELLWRHWGDQATLKNTSSTQRAQHIQQAIQQALLPIIQKHPWSFPPLIQSIETNRLTQLVNAVIEWELRRPAFRIHALEEPFSIDLNGLPLTIRVDRIDELIDEPHQWVIDYKTSLPTNKPWYDERPEAPQLLLYALLDEKINLLLFLQLKASSIVCAGFAEENYDLNGIQTPKNGSSFEDQRAEWREHLTVLAEEFKTGHCPPTPRRESTCTICEFKLICRISDR